jgi:hypothetical protein
MTGATALRDKQKRRYRTETIRRESAKRQVQARCAAVVQDAAKPLRLARRRSEA